MKARYDEGGQRLTDCCGTYSTYAEGRDGVQRLCCKRCWCPVAVGQGDGAEFLPGVDQEAYYRGEMQAARAGVAHTLRHRSGLVAFVVDR